MRFAQHHVVEMENVFAKPANLGYRARFTPDAALSWPEHAPPCITESAQLLRGSGFRQFVCGAAKRELFRSGCRVGKRGCFF